MNEWLIFFAGVILCYALIALLTQRAWVFGEDEPCDVD